MTPASNINIATCRRLLLFAPHPDDESLTAGGLIQQVLRNGANVRVVFITDGGNNPWPQRVLERRWRIRANDRARWGARRREEATNALTKLGVSLDDVRFLGFPDQGLTKILLAGAKNLVANVAFEITEFRPDLVVSPAMWDRHRDHNAFAVLLQLAVDNLSAEERSFSELQYVTHRRRKQAAPDFILPLSDGERKVKRDAILCHTTQVKLSGRRFLSFAEGDEIFYRKPSPAVENENHPVRKAEIVGRRLLLRLETPEAPDEYILHLATKSGKRTLILPNKSSAINVMDSASRTIVTQAQFRTGKDGHELFIPLSALDADERIYLKLDSRSGFYDPHGWREIPEWTSGDIAQNRTTIPLQHSAPPRVCCVLPCYNVADRCGEVLRQVLNHADDIIAIDDGSTDGTGNVLKAIAGQYPDKIRVISFPENRGKGAGLLAAFQRALAEIPFDVLITIDADGQHNPTDLPRLAQACVTQQAALVIGERVARGPMPWRSRLGNGLTSKLFQRLYSISPRDTQSGLRAMNRELVEAIVKVIKPSRYETELQILMLTLDLQMPLSTVPIQTVYFDQNRLSHFRPVKDSLRIYWALLMWHLSARHDVLADAETPSAA